jgi:ubiquinone/menaquinone biosynthesis C-methylase UbiE
VESFTHRHASDPGGEHAHGTAGRLLDRGWRYDLEVWFVDTFVLRGQLRELRRRVFELGELRAGQTLLDVGCGTGTLAIEAAARVGEAGRVAGIDPAPRQIARARAKARRAGLGIDFRVAAIEGLPFPEGAFDVVTSTLRMHHLPDDLKRQGLTEIARVVKPGGRLVVCDFKESSGRYVPDLLRDAAFVGVEAEELLFPRTHRRWSGAILAVGRK